MCGRRPFWCGPTGDAAHPSATPAWIRDKLEETFAKFQEEQEGDQVAPRPPQVSDGGPLGEGKSFIGEVTTESGRSLPWSLWKCPPAGRSGIPPGAAPGPGAIIKPAATSGPPQFRPPPRTWPWTPPFALNSTRLRGTGATGGPGHHRPHPRHKCGSEIRDLITRW